MRTNKRIAGITLVEAIVVIALIAVLVSMLLPALRHAKSRSGPSCWSNLRQIGTAYRVWASDNGDRFPAAAPIAEGGWRELLNNRNAGPYCWTNYVAMQNELGQSPRILICPSDLRKPAENFSSIGNSNISYFVGVTASQSDPQSILGGDRNLSPGTTPRRDYGFSPVDNKGNDVLIRTNLAYCWSLKMHNTYNVTNVKCGNLLFADGSVQSIQNTHFGFNYQTNAAVQPPDTSSTPANWPPPQPEFRLIFP